MKTRSGDRTGKWTRYVLALAAMVAAAGLVVAGGATEAKADASNGTFNFASSPVSVTEGQQAVLTISRTGGSVGRVDVHYFVTAGTATAPDWGGGSLSGYVTFLDGVTTNQLLIATTDDVDVEGTEQFTVTLDGFSGAYLSGLIGSTINIATVSITDNDGPATFSFGQSSYNFSEGASSQSVTVNRSGAAGLAVSVDLASVNGSAIAGSDYTAISQTLAFGIGVTSISIPVSITDDPTQEVAEAFTLDLSNPSSGTITGTDPVTVNIAASDGPQIQWSAANFNVAEGNAGTSTVTISATRTGDLTLAASVPWSTGDGTATTADSDYVAGGATFSWGAGIGGTQSATVTINGDATPENDETIVLSFGSPTGATIGSPASATITILNDDSVSSLSFSATNYSVTEASTTVTVTVNRGGTTTGTVGVNFATSDGSAVSASDYTANSGTLTFGTGVTTQTFSVTILNDAVAEPTETLNLTLSSATGGATLTSPSTATITIFDDESGGPTVTSLSPAGGPIGGGNTVYITGTNFTGGTTVKFGLYFATNVVVVSPTLITATAPAQFTAGLVDVTVTHPTLGTSSTAGTGNDYLYDNGPTVTSVSPNTGASTGTTFVTVTGTNFTPTGMTVTFGGTQATFAYISSTSLTAVTPAHSAGVVDVIVTTLAGSSPNTVLDDFTYTGTSAPVITSISPTSGPVGTLVTVTGSGFLGSSVVTVGGVSASFTVVSDTTITLTVPSTTPGGSVDIRVTNSGGTSPNVAADNFNNTSSSGATTTYTLYFRWTLIAWTGIDNLSVYNAVRGIETGTANPNTNDVSGQVTAIWYWDGSSQSYKGFFVGFENVPGANDFTTMKRGISYWLAVASTTTSWTVLVGQ